MRQVWERWRNTVLFVGGLCAALLLLILAFGGRREVPADAAPQASSPSKVVEAAPPSSAPKPTIAPGAPLVVAPATSALPASSAVWPVPLPLPPGAEGATWDPNFGDPFDGKQHRPGDVRELTSVGAFRLGVTNDSKVHDERAVIAILQQLGEELDAKDRGRSESYERRIMEYQSMLDRYRPKLAPLMEGAFAMKGNGWTDTERVVLPRGAAEAGIENVH